MGCRTKLIAVGACAIDTILTVPYYPEEDSKLRATSFQKRRGGNTSNTLEVLQQLVCCDVTDVEPSRTEEAEADEERKAPKIELHLIATLPSPKSSSMPAIRSSFHHRCLRESGHDRDQGAKDHTQEVSLLNCVVRHDYLEPVSSYIIASEANSSRTIVNNNALPEMSFEELKAQVSILLAGDPVDQMWFHFEGRNVEVAAECIKWLRQHPAFLTDKTAPQLPRLRISVELEKPGREGLQAPTLGADVILYSRDWAEHKGYRDAEECLSRQCNRKIIDTTGAGDTFIAGVLFGLLFRDCLSQMHPHDAEKLWSLKHILDFANGLAGRKVLQHGFDGLGELSRELREEIDAR